MQKITPSTCVASFDSVAESLSETIITSHERETHLFETIITHPADRKSLARSVFFHFRPFGGLSEATITSRERKTRLSEATITLSKRKTRLSETTITLRRPKIACPKRFFPFSTFLGLVRDDHHVFQRENRLSEATIDLSKCKTRLSEATITFKNPRRVMVH
jgi:hypothetical protein